MRGSLRQKRERRERAQYAHDPRRDRRDRRGLRQYEPCPHVEKPRQGPVSVTHIHILAARIWLHRAKLRVCERAEKREDAAHYPGEINQLRGTDSARHLLRHQKDAAADDRPNDYRRRVAHIKRAWKFFLLHPLYLLPSSQRIPRQTSAPTRSAHTR